MGGDAELDGSTAEGVQKRIIDNLARVPGIERRVARRFALAVDHDEIVQGGVLGLIDAARRYQPNQRCGFASYSEIRIRGAVIDQLRALDWLPRSIRRAERAVDQGMHAAEQREGCAQRAEDVAHALGMEASAALCCTLEAFEDGSLAQSGTWANARDPFGALCAERMRRSVDEAVGALPESERGVVSLFYWTELGPELIARALELEPCRVRVLHVRALQRLRVRLREHWE